MTDPSTDYYAVLGVPRRASEGEIIRAYRRRLRRVHPDTRTADNDQLASVSGQAEPGDAGKALALLREAFAVLGDPTRRAAYDRHTRPAPPAPGSATPTRPQRQKSFLAGPPDPPLRAGPVRYRPNPPPGGER